MSTPQSSIYICSGVPLTNRYDHTLYFATKAEQEVYFSSKVIITYNDYTYLRRSWKLKVSATMKAARAWSYLFFRNGTDKYYYFFINQIEYINDATVELTLEMDVIQTYLFDWKLHPCYVEREHTATDEVGANTVDEGLEVGEYVTAATEKVDLSELAIMIAANIDLVKYSTDSTKDPDKVIGANYGHVFGGFQLFTSDMDTEWDVLSETLHLLSDGYADSVFAMWMYPKALITTPTASLGVGVHYVHGRKNVNYETTHGEPTTIDGYTPKNKKLLQYPYCYIYTTNNGGGAAVYQYHHFINHKPSFTVMGNLAPDASVRLTPISYKGVVNNYDESLMMGNFPLCSWNSDSYKMWLAQNQNQQNLGYVMAGLKIVGGVAAGVGGAAATAATGGAGAAVGFAGVSSGIGLVTSGIADITSQLAQRADKEIQPPQARGSFSGTHNVANNLQTFSFYHKTIDAYHARMIDDYFTMYGYACRMVKTPNINARPTFTYVKTIGSNATGNFCQEDLKTINTIFDKGITFWKNTDVGNYALDNSV